MPTQNLWSHLPPEIQNELIKHANSIGTDTIYIWRRPYYEQRNSFIWKRYHQLKASTDLTNKEIYAQIAREISRRFGNISPKAVQNVVYAWRSFPNS